MFRNERTDRIVTALIVFAAVGFVANFFVSNPITLLASFLLFGLLMIPVAVFTLVFTLRMFGFARRRIGQFRREFPFPEDARQVQPRRNAARRRRVELEEWP